MPVTLRRVREDDDKLVKALFITMSTETPTAFSGTVADLQNFSDESWQQWSTNVSTSPNMEGFVAEDNGEACGFVTGSVLTHVRLATFEAQSTSGEVDALSDTTMLGRMWVAPHYRGQGIGQLLIRAVLDWAKEKNQRRVLLAVSDGNEAALRIYARAGFVPTGYSIPHPNYPELPIHMMEFIF